MSNDIARIWKEELEGAAKAIISAKVLGTKIPMETMQVEVELPSAMVKALRRACERLGLDEEVVQQMASSMASAGFTKAIEEKFMDSQTPAQAAPSANLNAQQLLGEFQSGQFDMTGISDKISQVQSLLGQLNGIAGIGNATNADPAATENCSKPDVPSGKKDG